MDWEIPFSQWDGIKKPVRGFLLKVIGQQAEKWMELGERADLWNWLLHRIIEN